MNKRIKIYCIIISIIYVGVVFNNLSSYVSAFKFGVDMGRESAKTDRDLSVFHLKVIPESGAFSYPEKIMNTLTGKEMNAEVSELKIMLFENADVLHSGLYNFIEVFKIIMSFLFIGITIYLPVLFIKIIRSVTKGNIIESKMISRISRMGWVIIIFFLLETIGGVINVVGAQEILAVENYRMVMDYSNYPFLILGVTTLLLSEILRVSLNLKEEQELTI
ncbi:MAG: DUF2975 domain-containing protein [Dysgonomonas sp.]|nr:DUF2975 domain-containing protein [Dysgonomonas sp.]